MMTNNARHALVWLLTVHSATRTSSRTHHRNPGLDIRAIFEEGRAKVPNVADLTRFNPGARTCTTLG